MLEMSENSDSEATMSSSIFPTSSVTIAAPKLSQEEAAIISTQPNIDTEPFYLESDCVALRNNADYSCLLKTLVLLEAQRVQACQDLERLIDFREHALDPNTRPSEFVKNELPRLELPERQKVYCLPQIDWSRYFDSATTTAVGSTPGAMNVSGGALDSDCLEAIRLQNSLNRATRSTRIHQQQAKIESTRKSSRQQQQQSDQEAASGQESGGGGRKKPGNERNFNKPWTVEEQRRLEELLIEIPPEENEASRWRKIAEKLGTRSQLQVQSHCQKYFIKLAKAGLPIPGRMPNLRSYKSKKGTRGRAAASARDAYGLGRATNTDLTGRRIVGRGVSLNQISSMWTSFNPPMIMNDENEAIDQRELDFLNDHDDDDDDQDEDNDEEEGEDDEDQESDYNQEENNFEQFENADENLQNQQSEIRYNIKEEPIDNDDDYSIAKTSSRA